MPSHQAPGLFAKHDRFVLNDLDYGQQVWLVGEWPARSARAGFPPMTVSSAWVKLEPGQQIRYGFGNLCGGLQTSRFGQRHGTVLESVNFSLITRVAAEGE
jgi:hypothetical protein